MLPRSQDYGGAINNWGGTLKLSSCTLSSNDAQVRPGPGPRQCSRSASSGPAPRPPNRFLRHTPFHAPIAPPTRSFPHPALSRLDAIALTRRDSPPRQSGGAINNYDGTTTLSDCTLSSNYAYAVRASAAPRPPPRPATTPTAPLSAPSLPKPLR